MSSLRFYPVRKDSSYYEHFHRYFFAKEIVENLEVLDISCGEGYGTHIMSETAKNIIGCDIDPHAVLSAQNKYIKSNLKYQVGDCTNIPFNNEKFNAVVSFETIEHFAKQKEFLYEAKRVLKKDGILIISTPDKRVYSDERNYHNEDHVREFTKEEFIDFLKEKFQYVELYGQKFTRHSVILRDDLINSRLQLINYEEKPFDPMFLIAICSDRPIVEVQENTIFGDNDSDSEFKEAALGIKDLEEQVKVARTALEGKDKEIEIARTALEGKDKEIEIARTALEGKDKEIEIARVALEGKNKEIEIARIALEGKDKEIEIAKAALEGKDKEIEIARTALEGKDKEIEIARTALEGKDREIEIARAALEGKDREIEIARAALEGKDKEIEIARAALEGKDKEIEIARAVLEWKDKEIEIARTTLEGKDEEIEIARTKLEGRDGEIAIAKEKIEENYNEVKVLKQMIEERNNTLRWKIFRKR